MIMTAFRFIPSSLLVLILGMALVSTGCKSKKDTVTKYKYLLEEEGKATAAEVEPIPLEVDQALKEAETYLGTPYRYGGINKNGIDCSGLAMKSYAVAGVSLPRSTKDQAKEGTEIRREDLRKGDLVFFSAKNNGVIDHVGMVSEVNGQEVTFIHASTSKGVRYDRLDVGYWTNLFITARRVK